MQMTSTPSRPLSLADARQKAADAAFDAFRFGPDVHIESTNGWESTTPGRSMSRVMYVAPLPDEAASSDVASSDRITMTVTFVTDESFSIHDVYCLDAKGQQFGYFPLQQRLEINKSIQAEVHASKASVPMSTLAPKSPLAIERRPAP